MSNKEAAKDTYKRPLETFTDKLTKTEIENLLDDYEKVLDFDNLIVGDHIRYFKKENNKLKFRMGGVLVNKVLPKYIVLTNGKKPWSVQLESAILYKKMSNKKIRSEYQLLLDERDDIIKGLLIYIKQIAAEQTNNNYKPKIKNNK
jgi:hypothetical protein